MTEYRLPRLGKFRILLTQRCNLDCLYCHKEGQFSKRNENMTTEEFQKLTKIAYSFGLDEVKYSGGEPLLYDSLPELIGSSKGLGVPRVSVTTNGILLEERLDQLEQAGLDELSISLDTLDKETFEKLNRGSREDFERTFRGIEKAKDYPFNMNLNMSLTKYNYHEVGNMIEYAKGLGVPLRLISFIPLGAKHKREISTDASTIFGDLFSSAESVHRDESAPAYTQLKLKDGAEICLVDSSCFDCKLCGKSYALRLTTDGKLKPCLISEKGEIDVLTPLREGDIYEVKNRFAEAVIIKRRGLMKNFDIPIRDLSGEFLIEEP